MSYLAFSERVLGRSQPQAFPTFVDELLAWCVKAFSNCVSYVEAGTTLQVANTKVFQNNAFAWAKKVIDKREGFRRNGFVCFQLDIVRQFLLVCGGHSVDISRGMLYLPTYIVTRLRPPHFLVVYY